MRSTSLARLLVAFQAIAWGIACDITTNGVTQSTTSSPLTSTLFANSYVSPAQPYSSFYNVPLDLQNGFIAQFDVNMNFNGATVASGTANAATYPVLKLELSAGIPGVSTGATYAVTISPAGVIAGNAGDIKVAGTTFTGSLSFVLQYIGGTTQTLTLTSGNTVLYTATGVSFPTIFGNSGVGYIGLASVIDPFVTVGWSLSFNGLTIKTLPPSASTSLMQTGTASGVLTPTTGNAGTNVVLNLVPQDACNQVIFSPATVAAGYHATLTNAAQVSVVGTIGTADSTGLVPISFALKKSGTYNLAVTASGAQLSQSVPPGLVVVSPGGISGPNAVYYFSATTDTAKQPTVSLLVPVDQFGNNITSDPGSPGAPFYAVTVNNIVSTAPAYTTPLNVTWDPLQHGYVVSINLATAGTYDIHVAIASTRTEILNSPYVVTATVTVPGGNIVNQNNTLAIVFGVIGAIILILAIYGLWRGLRYRQKHREGKLREEQAIHQAKIKKHEAEVAASVLANPLVVTDEGGYVTQQQVEEAQKKADYQESLANIERLEVERLEVAIKLKQEQIAQIKKKKQEDEILSSGLKAKPVTKKKNEFGQKAS